MPGPEDESLQNIPNLDNEIGTSPFEGLNRAARRGKIRQQKAANKTFKRRFNAPKTRMKVNPVEKVLDEEGDDLEMLTSELQNNKAMDVQLKAGYQIYVLLNSMGVSEETCRDYFMPDKDMPKDKQEIGLRIYHESNPKTYKTNYPFLARMENVFFGGKVFYIDEEEKALVSSLKGDPSLTLKDIFQEVLRSRAASIELIRMQIDHLNQDAARRKQFEEDFKRLEAEETAVRLDFQAQIEIPEEAPLVPLEASVKAPEAPFGLEGWQLFWTNKFWSDNPNHLRQIPTTSREETRDKIAQAGNGQFSISAGSVLRAVEFHLLDRDHIQRALATRNKYASEEVKRWVKIKRGKDRIGILLPEDKPKTAIIFAGGRDVVYRNLGS